ncbi:MAG TPA: bifunctional 5,10-methylene-tetrahydrofolate dehydrogenase/5,10-methylene-tetrahydrofolate cyclohydrolase [Bacteroidetes bacterium]|jgi:methylenetetrahydrofolate dehydrogenase (NADP+)/methenyltetrahydrofolate cyclohydrolase|nr:bifunctional 5,10-methylene-tetrahydrofolate dehydrogenase/5,10-methylene-tetrahydrofolate cyclohydrolase [Bacteroidota bacterium]
MDNKLIEGKIVAEFIKEDLKVKTAALKRDKNITPCLAVMLVGDNPASKVYVNGKIKFSEELGYKSIVKELSSSTSENEVLQIINEWNEDPEINGILVQLPLPHQINETKVLLKIKPSKDVDGFHPENVGRLVAGLPGFISCTPAGIIELMKFYKINPSGMNAVIIGRSNIVGKPMLNLLYQKKEFANATVTICHTGTKDLEYYTKHADLLIAAIGSPKFVKGDFVKEGVIVFDVGVNRIVDTTKKSGYRLVGDVDFDEVYPKASMITPVPGGVGPLTIAMLMTNTYKSANNEYLY